MMTAALSPGDAIGNYILALYRILREWDCEVRLYTDHPNPVYPLPHQHTSAYQPTGNDVLWVHYSIYSENVHWVEQSPDVVVFDSQNVSPAWLFEGYDAHMQQLCLRGEAYLDRLVRYPDVCVVHTDYVQNDLHRRGYRRIHKLPMVVDTSRFTGQAARQWEPLLQPLDYLLFVGRIVPQKNLTVALDVFAELHRRRPALQFFLVGGHSLPGYSALLEERIAAYGLQESVLFVGKINEPDVLTSFFRNARFSVILSHWESFCVPIAESLYFGTPVLGNAVPPIPETMGPGGIVLEGTPHDMAARIDALWDDDDLYRHLQQAGQQHVQSFTDHRLRDALLRVFRDLANGI
jgi:glycosyltransferase involved in cell wall biosynthesis